MNLKGVTLKKCIEYASVKFEQKFREKSYTNGGYPIKYLFYREARSDMLIVVFGSCPRKGIKSRYNYVRTLKDIYANKLFTR